jgi:hypothetical protein
VSSTDRPDMSRSARIARHVTVSTALALLSDRRLARLVDDAPIASVGIGGTAVALEIDGIPVFAKRVPLTDLERGPEHALSTANLFDLPPRCQYGVGGVSFGVWRELAANVMTTNWVLGAHSENFPLMYHWRVLPGRLPVADEYADIEQVVERWYGAPGVRTRLTAIAQSTATVVLFLEHIPHNLTDWLASHPPQDTAAMVEHGLLSTSSFLTSHDLVHFDAHFANILTDGERLYVADFGLATSPRFDLSEVERDFLRLNSTHDVAYALMRLVNWLVTTRHNSYHPAERNEIVRQYVNRNDPLSHYAPTAVVMNDFYWQLFDGNTTTPYPAQDVREALDLIGPTIDEHLGTGDETARR